MGENFLRLPVSPVSMAHVTADILILPAEWNSDMWPYIACAFLLFLLGVTIHDLVQKKHAILRNFPIVGHFRYLFESVGPELRQYIVTSNNEELPFSRDQRSWVYASSKKANNYFGFGSDDDMELQPNYLIIKHAAFPLRNPRPDDPGYDPQYRLPSAKLLGGPRRRKKGIPSGFGCQCLGNEFWFAERPRR